MLKQRREVRGGEKAIFNLMTQSCPAREQLAGNWKSQWTGIPLLRRDGSTCRLELRQFIQEQAGFGQGKL